MSIPTDPRTHLQTLRSFAVQRKMEEEARFALQVRVRTPVVYQGHDVQLIAYVSYFDERTSALSVQIDAFWLEREPNIGWTTIRDASSWSEGVLLAVLVLRTLFNNWSGNPDRAPYPSQEVFDEAFEKEAVLTERKSPRPVKRAP